MKPCIREGTIEEAVWISAQLPEFVAPYPASAYRERLAGVPHLILLACVGGQAAGFKVGYELEGSFYSWMGGVLPDYRRRGVARALASEQESWAKQRGYSRLLMKSRNEHRAMLIFALSNGFSISSVEKRPVLSANRIWLEKVL